MTKEQRKVVEQAKRCDHWRGTTPLNQVEGVFVCSACWRLVKEAWGGGSRA